VWYGVRSGWEFWVGGVGLDREVEMRRVLRMDGGKEEWWSGIA